MLFKPGSSDSQIAINLSRTSFLTKAVATYISIIVPTHTAHRKLLTAPLATILSAYTSVVKKETTLKTFRSLTAVYSTAMPLPVNCTLVWIVISSSSASKLLKILQMLLQKEKIGIEYEADRYIGISSYKSKRGRDSMIKYQ